MTLPPLHGYQKEMVDFCLQNLFSRSTGAGLFADPGLGKTRVTLQVIQDLVNLNEVRRVLVVAPKRVCRMVWPLEVEKWEVGLRYDVLCGRAKKGLSSSSQIDIINPESLHHLQSSAGVWDMLVVDETTKFKNFTSKRMKSLRKLLSDTPLRMGLTGTPVANSLLDLFAQVYILDMGESLGRTLNVFRARYATKGGWQGRQWVPRKGVKDELMGAISHLCLRMDAETHLNMPELVFNDIFVELPAGLRAEYRRLKQQLLLQLESTDILLQNAASAYTKMRQLANGSVLDDDRVAHHAHHEKTRAILELREELWGKPLLVFYTYRADGAQLAEKLNADSAGTCRTLGGDTKEDEANQILHDWNAGEIPVLAMQIQTGSHGLNLQSGGCQDVVFFGECDSLDQIEQAYRRVYRQGVQGSQVRVHRILTKDTVDQVIRARLDDKHCTQGDFLNALRDHARS